MSKPLVFSVACALALVVTGGSVFAAERPPNIVFILADDLGWTDLGCYGSRFYETPNIDRLARHGMRFTSAYTNGPNCAPTRACLMSGQYTPRHGIYTVETGARGRDEFRKMVPVENQTRLPLEITTLADALRSAGYVTGMFGKWHLGNGPQYHPMKRGFETAVVTGGSHFAPQFRTDPRAEVAAGTYLADFLTDRAVEFLRAHRERPFFLYLPHFAVHTPLQAKEELIARFREKSAERGHQHAVYAAMIASLDESVGRVLDALDESNLSDNTLVIFTSDNGGVGGYEELGGSTGKNITENAPLRGGKGMLYEGGIRVPLIARWPGIVEQRSTCVVPVATIDFYPTFLDVARGRSPEQRLDGVSFLPLLRDSGRGTLQREALYWHFPGYLQANETRGTWRTTPAGAIRQVDYKLLEFFEDGRLELYHLSDDLGEQKNLAASQPEKARELQAKLKAWRAEINAPLPMRKQN